MTEDQLVRLFGDITVVQLILWLIAAGLLIWLVVKIWPAASKLIVSINLMLSLAEKLSSIDGTLERVRAQVENSHSTNLRDELDGDRKIADQRHGEVLDHMRGMKKDIGRIDDREVNLATEINGVRSDLAAHVEWSRGQEDRIDGLEITMKPKGK